MTRSQSRENAFILVFENLFNPDYSFADMREFTAESEQFEIDEFTEALYSASVENAARLDGEIEPFLKNWKLSRLPKTVLAVLRVSMAQLDGLAGEVPASVVVNEAVELGKKYATEKDASFINGILGAVIRSREEA